MDLTSRFAVEADPYGPLVLILSWDDVKPYPPEN